MDNPNLFTPLNRDYFLHDDNLFDGLMFPFPGSLPTFSDYNDDNIFGPNLHFLDDDNKINPDNDNNNKNNISNGINVNNNPTKKEEKAISTTSINKNTDKSLPSTKDNKNSNSNENVGKAKKNKKKKLGRRKKGEKYNNEEKVHSKKDPDNMKIKFKKLFFKKLINCLNDKLSKSKNQKLKKLRFKKLNAEYTKDLKKDLNIEMLNLSASVVLSKDIADKYKIIKKDHNKKLIKLIYEENEQILITILDKTIRELIESFCSNTKDDLILENYRLCDCIDDISKKEKDDDYITKFTNEAKNFETNLEKIFGRKSKKDKLST